MFFDAYQTMCLLSDARSLHNVVSVDVVSVIKSELLFKKIGSSITLLYIDFNWIRLCISLECWLRKGIFISLATKNMKQCTSARDDDDGLVYWPRSVWPSSLVNLN